VKIFLKKEIGEKRFFRVNQVFPLQEIRPLWFFFLSLSSEKKNLDFLVQFSPKFFWAFKNFQKTLKDHQNHVSRIWRFFGRKTNFREKLPQNFFEEKFPSSEFFYWKKTGIFSSSKRSFWSSYLIGNLSDNFLFISIPIIIQSRFSILPQKIDRARIQIHCKKNLKRASWDLSKFLKFRFCLEKNFNNHVRSLKRRKLWLIKILNLFFSPFSPLSQKYSLWPLSIWQRLILSFFILPTFPIVLRNLLKFFLERELTTFSICRLNKLNG